MHQPVFINSLPENTSKVENRSICSTPIGDDNMYTKKIIIVKEKHAPLCLESINENNTSFAPLKI